MGLPIKHRKKFVSHKKRWEKSTIVSEKDLVRDYALKNKKEIRRVELLVSKYKKLAKMYNKDDSTKESPEAVHFLESLKAKGIMPQTTETLDEVLDITVRNLLERRLSNVIYKNKLAKTPTQARQFVVHKHVKVGGKVVDSPSMPVTLAQEATIEFRPTSALADEEHPERKLFVESVEEVVEEESSETQTDEANEEGKSKADIKEEALDDEEQDEVKE